MNEHARFNVDAPRWQRARVVHVLHAAMLSDAPPVGAELWVSVEPRRGLKCRWCEGEVIVAGLTYPALSFLLRTVPLHDIELLAVFATEIDPQDVDEWCEQETRRLGSRAWLWRGLSYKRLLSMG